MDILLVGGFGKLGSFLQGYFKKRGFKVGIYGRNKSKPIQPELNQDKIYTNLAEYFNFNHPDLIINLAALTNVDKCQMDKNLAYKSNIEPCLEIKKYILNKDTKVIHISTDHLYAGNGPHKEDNVNPINEYAQTKLQAENIISSPRTIILRTNYVGKSCLIDKPTFTDWLYQSIKNKYKINLFKDIIFSPLHLFDLAENIHLILNKPLAGTFNLGSSTSISKADFALKFAKALNIDMRNYNICNSSEIKNRIERPKDMSMDVQRFEEKFNLKLPSISSTISKCAKDYQN